MDEKKQVKNLPEETELQIYNFDTYNSLTPNWYYKVLR